MHSPSYHHQHHPYFDDHHMQHQRHVSSASYAPLLIDPVHSQTHHESTLPAPPRLKFPLPLPVLAAVDATFTFHHAATAATSSFLLVLCTARVLVLCIFTGFSRRWRDRGGFVASICGLTILSVVWDICEGQLKRGKVVPGRQEQGTEEIPKLFLGLTALIAAVEYLSFILLLRLSPPGSHRINPLSLRQPASAIQVPTEFAYDTVEDDDLLTATTPRNTTRGILSSPRTRRHSRSGGHVRQPSQKSVRIHHAPTTSISTATDISDFDRDTAFGTTSSIPPEEAFQLQAAADEEEGAWTDEYEDGTDTDPDVEANSGLLDEEDGFSDSSSISESSIIDLPLPRSPNRIAPPTSVSVNRGLNVLAAIEDLPIAETVGAVVRRTRSARFLGGRSWGSAHGEEGRIGGYGTFGGNDRS